MYLVCGGAGYIGSHMVAKLIEENKKVVVIDNLSTGHRASVNDNAILEIGDIRDKDFIKRVFDKYDIDSVFHFAASSLVGESITDPLKYYDNNVLGSHGLIQAMEKKGVDKLVFSSTAAVYGEAESIPILESHPKNPSNPYGETKLAVERMLRWSDNANGIRSVALRYFNVGGAHSSGSIGEDHRPESHLIPNILKVALGQKSHLEVFGDDYDTKDGTCIRDYIHIEDLINAHFKAMEYLDGGGLRDVFNLGNGDGFSVLEMILTAKEVTNREIPYNIVNRRPGDPAKLIASANRAKEILGWEPKHRSVRSIIESAWRWHEKMPQGYGEQKHDK